MQGGALNLGINPLTCRSQRTLADVLPENSGYLHPTSSAHEARRSPAPLGSVAEGQPALGQFGAWSWEKRWAPFTFNLEAKHFRENRGGRCHEEEKSWKLPQNLAGRSRNPSKSWEELREVLKVALIPPGHARVRGEGLWTGSRARLYIYRTHLKPKDVKFPYKLFTKVIPPAIAMQNPNNCSWGYTAHGAFSYLKRTLSEMFVRSRANYWLCHKKCLLAQHFVGWSD